MRINLKLFTEWTLSEVDCIIDRVSVLWMDFLYYGLFFVSLQLILLPVYCYSCLCCSCVYHPGRPSHLTPKGWTPRIVSASTTQTNPLHHPVLALGTGWQSPWPTSTPAHSPWPNHMVVADTPTPVGHTVTGTRNGLIEWDKGDKILQIFYAMATFAEKFQIIFVNFMCSNELKKCYYLEFVGQNVVFFLNRVSYSDKMFSTNYSVQ